MSLRDSMDKLCSLQYCTMTMYARHAPANPCVRLQSAQCRGNWKRSRRWHTFGGLGPESGLRLIRLCGTLMSRDWGPQIQIQSQEHCFRFLGACVHCVQNCHCARTAVRDEGGPDGKDPN